MTVINKLSTRNISNYYLIITIAYMLVLFGLPHGIWNYAPVFYIFFGPIVLSALHYRYGSKLNLYTFENHPDLMKKYAIHYGVKKGEVLNIFDVIQNKNEFFKLNDQQLSNLVKMYSHSLKFIAISFATVLLVGLRIMMMWN